MLTYPSDNRRQPLRVFLLLALGFGMAGCESKEAKLQRLQTEEVITGALARRWRDSVETLEADTAKRNQILDSLGIANRKHDLATRELNLFMNGK